MTYAFQILRPLSDSFTISKVRLNLQKLVCCSIYALLICDSYCVDHLGDELLRPINEKKSMLDKLVNALAPGWVGSVIGILGIAAAAVTYLLGRQRSILAYRTKGARLLGHTEARLPSEITV